MALPKKVISASVIGGVLEFYDFGLYGTLAFAFAPAFFPSEQAFLSVLGAYAVFAVGFFARPVGAIVFGHIGDKHGRRFALFCSLILMSFSTLIIGLLPDYHSIGLLAPVLMVIARLLQGLSMGGEYSSALIFAIEHGAKKDAGRIGGLISSGSMSGLLLSSLASACCMLPQAPSWAWRVPFLIGFLVSLAGIYLRTRIEETPIFMNQTVNTRTISFLEGLRSNFRNVFSMILLCGFNGISIYTYTVFLSSFIAKEILIPEHLVKLYTCMGTILLIGSLIIFGWLSDKVNRLQLISIGAILTTLTASLLFYHLSELSLLAIMGYQLIFVISLGMYSGPLNALVIETFPAAVRCRCSSLSYNLGMGVIGGSAPLVAGFLSMHPSKNMLLSLYFAITGTLALLSLGGLLYVASKRSVKRIDFDTVITEEQNAQLS